PERVLEVAWFHRTRGISQADLVREAGMLPAEADQFLRDALTDARLKSVTSDTGKALILHADVVDEIHDRVTSTLSKLHAEFPLMSTHDRQRVQSQLGYIGDDTLVRAAVDDLLRQKKLVGDVKRIALAEHKPKLSANQRK